MASSSSIDTTSPEPTPALTESKKRNLNSLMQRASPGRSINQCPQHCIPPIPASFSKHEHSGCDESTWGGSWSLICNDPGASGASAFKICQGSCAPNELCIDVMDRTQLFGDTAWCVDRPDVSRFVGQHLENINQESLLNTGGSGHN